jgi:REP element-mobilizing transposase RayT
MSYTYLRYHVTFSTRDREPIIKTEWTEELHRYVSGIVHGERGRLIAIDGIADHIHMFLSTRSDQAIADIIGKVKCNSSGWIHQRWADGGNFHWQEGYGAFTVSRSGEAEVINYSKNQAKHHRKVDFKDEFRKLLKAHGIEFDERYIWK